MNDKELTKYWTEDLKGLSVFGVIKDAVDKDPGILSRIKMFIRKLEMEIESNA